VVAAGVTAMSGIASAGRTDFAWPYDTETLPKRGVELQTWIVELDDLGTGSSGLHLQQTDVWWETLIGVTDQLELSIPMIFKWEHGDGVQNNFTFERYGLEGRYRFVEREDESGTAPAVVPLVRAAVFREVTNRGGIGFEGDLVLSYTAGPFHAVADARFAYTHVDLSASQMAAGKQAENYMAAPSVGISIKAVDDLRVGVEGYAQIAMTGSHEQDFYIAGPDLSWTHGRFWITAVAGIGLHNIHAAPRVIWGVLF
jgi:hypothetical protein